MTSRCSAVGAACARNCAASCSTWSSAPLRVSWNPVVSEASGTKAALTEAVWTVAIWYWIWPARDIPATCSADIRSVVRPSDLFERGLWSPTRSAPHPRRGDVPDPAGRRQGPIRRDRAPG
ncbi:hypothetical protein [Cellulomonas hominis]